MKLEIRNSKLEYETNPGYRQISNFEFRVSDFSLPALGPTHD
jgi:hypothetical protein